MSSTVSVARTREKNVHDWIDKKYVLKSPLSEQELGESKRGDFSLFFSNVIHVRVPAV